MESLKRYIPQTVLFIILLVLAALLSGAVPPDRYVYLQGVILLGLLFSFPKTDKTSWPFLICLGFTCYSAIRYLFCTTEYVARMDLLNYVGYTAVFYIAAHFKNQNNKAILITAAIITVLNSAYSFVQVYHPELIQFRLLGQSQGLALNFDRPSGLWPCPNHGAGWIGMTLPILIAITLYYPNKTAQTLAIIGTGITTASLYISASRGGILACILSSGIILAIESIKQRNRYKAILLIAVIALSVGATHKFVSKSATERITEAVSTNLKDDSSSYRFKFWEGALKITKEHPLFGVGPGLFNTYWPTISPETMQGNPVRTHNSYINILVDLGIIGAVIAGCFLVSLALNAKPVLTSEPHWIPIACTVGLLHIAVQEAFDFNLYIPTNAILAAIMAATLTTNTVTLKKPLQLFFKALWCLTVVCLTWQTIKGTALHVYRVKTEQSKSLAERIQFIQASQLIEPTHPGITTTLGNYYAFAKEPSKAQAEFTKLSSIDPCNAMSYILLAKTAVNNNDIDTATKASKFAAIHGPNQWQTLELLGILEAKAGYTLVSSNYLARSMYLRNYESNHINEVKAKNR